MGNRLIEGCFFTAAHEFLCSYSNQHIPILTSAPPPIRRLDSHHQQICHPPLSCNQPLPPNPRHLIARLPCLTSSSSLPNRNGSSQRPNCFGPPPSSPDSHPRKSAKTVVKELTLSHKSVSCSGYHRSLWRLHLCSSIDSLCATQW